MVTITLRLSPSMHTLVRDLAREEDISMNQLITPAPAEKLSALATETYLEERAARGYRAKFEAALGKVADIEPLDECDRLN